MTDQETQGFYAERSQAESERLEFMAQVADSVSYVEIADVLQPHSRVLDVGAGESLTLGQRLIEETCDYVAVDLSEAVVNQHLAAGHSSMQSYAEKLDLKGDSCDVLHSRFTWGWLSDAQRSMALREMLRVGRDTQRIALIDYDWSVCDGPEPFRLAVEDVVSTMTLAGFDTNYGAKLYDDVRDKLESILHDPADVDEVLSDAKRTPLFYDEQIHIDSAMPTIRLTANAIIGQLEGYQMKEMSELAARIKSNLAMLETYANTYPNELVRLPDMVSVHIDIESKATQLNADTLGELASLEQAAEAREQFEKELLVPGHDYDVIYADVPGLEHVGIARTSAAKLAARRLQASSYLKENMITQHAIGIDGAMLPQVDSTTLVERSTYFLATNGEGKLSGIVRLIDVEDKSGDTETLPSLKRLRIENPAAADEMQTILHEHTSNPKVLEVSALAKDPRNGNLLDVVRSVVALARYAEENNYDYGILGLQESRVAQIAGVFGKDSLRRLSDNADATYSLELPGVKKSMKFVPMIVDAQRFVSQVHEHAIHQMEQHENRVAPLFQVVAAMTQPTNK